MYIDKDKNERISIMNITHEEALLIAMALTGETICVDPKIRELSSQLYKSAEISIEASASKKHKHVLFR